MPKDQNELPEIVGSKDLRETFKNGGRVRGSFFINNVEFHQFEANSIAGLIASINAKADQAHVQASIDEGYHLVLEANSPADITIRDGRAWEEPPPGANDLAAQVKVAMRELMREERRHRGDDDHGPESALEAMGLEPTADAETAGQGDPGIVPPGMSADDRRRARHERAVASGAIRGLPADLASKEWHGSRAVPQGAAGGRDMQDRRFNPVGDDRSVARAASKPGQDANNPEFQRAPSSNSDGQPTVHDDVGRGQGS